jgi:hypothetical protein
MCNEQMDHLTEPGIRDHLFQSLEQCKKMKMTYYTYVMNISLFVLFVVGVSALLYFKKKTKLSPSQKDKKNEEDRLYIVNRIRSLQLDKLSNYKN